MIPGASIDEPNITESPPRAICVEYSLRRSEGTGTDGIIFLVFSSEGSAFANVRPPLRNVEHADEERQRRDKDVRNDTGDDAEPCEERPEVRHQP